MNNRIDKLLKNLAYDEAVFISSYPNIYYYSGFESEDAFLIISQNCRMLVTDSRYTVQAKHQTSGFDIIDISKGWKEIFDQIPNSVIGFEEKALTVFEFEKYKNYKHFKPMQNVINAPRRIKDDYEIKKISEAERLGDEAFNYILNKIKPGVSEKEVALEIEYFMKKNGARALSFETIAASGYRSAMPHGIASDKIIEKGDLFTLDFGCVLEGYCSDMTRTLAVGRIDAWQHDIYNLVLSAQNAALAEISAGKKCSDIDAAARNVIKEAGFGLEFGHALGHSVGIEIHEEPVLSPKSDDIVQNGNVLTIEPGIYIEGKGGVRIEDLVSIIDGKACNLTKSEKGIIII